MNPRRTSSLLKWAATLALPIFSGMAQGAAIALDQAQIDAMGLTFQSPETITQVEGYPYPAMAAIPANRQTTIAAPANGLVREVHVVHGDVHAGTPIITLESATLLAAQQDWLTTLADLSLAQSEYKRAKSLREAGSLSQKKFLQAENRYTVLKRQQQMQKRQLLYLGLSPEQLQTLEKTRKLIADITLEAPHDGVLFDLMVTPGDRVEAGATLARVGATDQIVVDVDVPLDEAATLEVGQTAIAQNRPRQGRIAFIDRRANPLTQRVTIHALFDNSDGAFRPGELLRLQFVSPLAKQRTAWRLPVRGVIEVEGVPTIFLRRNDGLEPLAVELLMRDSRFAVVRAPATESAESVQLLTSGAVYVKAMLGGNEE